MNNKLFTKSIKKEKFKNENLCNPKIMNIKIIHQINQEGKIQNENLWNPNEFNSLHNV